MPETKQISATIDVDLAAWILSQSSKEKRTFSQMVEILLEEAKDKRELKKEKIK